MNRRLVIPTVLLVLALAGAVAFGNDHSWLWVLPFALVVVWGLTIAQKPQQRRPAAEFTQPGRHRVVLQEPGGKPLEVILQVMRATGLRLREAKQMVDDAPVVVAEGLSEASAELVADRLRAAGARALAAPIGEK